MSKPYFLQPGQYQFEIHVYTLQGVQEYFQNCRADALAVARDAWDLENVYKVKVWDLLKGPVQRNNPRAEGLIKEYI